MSERRYGGPNGYGHKPDPDTVSHPSARHLVGSYGAPTPEGADLSGCIPFILDQARTSSCVGHAIALAILVRLLVQRLAGKLPDPLLVYKLALCVDRVPALDGSLPPLQDAGSSPDQAYRAIASWGCADDTRTDPTAPANSNGVTDEPDLGALERAAKKLYVGPYTIDAATLPERVAAMRRALAGGYPVTAATAVDSAFEAADGSAVMTAPKATDILGWHYIFFVGYRTTADGKTIFKLVNSWSVLWGAAGLIEVDEAFVEQLLNVYAVDVKLQEAA